MPTPLLNWLLRSSDQSDGGGGGGDEGPRRVTTCSFCNKNSREVGPMVEGPGDVFICTQCVDLCRNIFQQEKQRSSRSDNAPSSLPSPKQIVEHLDRYVIGQDQAKRFLAVAVHAHYLRIGGGPERPELDESDAPELEKSNVLMVGPTGTGKTLLAKSLARMLDVPFAIGDATLTEAGYVGEDVENLLLRLWKPPTGMWKPHSVASSTSTKSTRLAGPPKTSRSPGMSRRRGATSPAENAGRHHRQRPPARWTQAPGTELHPDRHLEHLVCVRRIVRWTRRHHSPPRGQDPHWLQRNRRRRVHQG